MNDSQELTLNPPTERAGFLDSLFRKLVLKMLTGLPRGHLQLILPEGETIVLGQDTDQPPLRLQINRESFFKRIALGGGVGFGEGYIAKDWETDDLFAVLDWFILNQQAVPTFAGSRRKRIGISMLSFAKRFQHLGRANTKEGSRKNIEEHYDLGNDFFALFLDPSMTYSSAYFTDPEQSLESAQIAKIDRLCQILQLKPTDHLLEVGTGWGTFSLYAAKTYGCKITTLTISPSQANLAKERHAAAGMSDQIEVRLQDYRDVTGQFDKIVTVEMLEAVGDEFLDGFFDKCAEVLKPNGLMAHQIICCAENRHQHLKNGADFIQTHIFPGSLLLSVSRTIEAANRKRNMELVDLEDMGLSYAKTLRIWAEACVEKEPELRAQGLSEEFLRKWDYYLRYCQAGFASRHITVYQTLWSPSDNRAYQPLGPQNPGV